MPSQQADARTRALFGTGDRESGVEHLVHLSKLHEVSHGKLGRFAPESIAPPAAMASRFRKRQEDLDNHVRETNQHLFEKLERHASLEHRRKQKLNLVPITEKKTFFQGSNKHTRLLEAQRIDEENEVLIQRLATAKTFATNSDYQRDRTSHEALVKRLSRFKPSEPYAGATLITESLGKPATSRKIKKGPGGSSGPGTPRQEWQGLMQSDLRESRRVEDNKLRGGYNSEDREVFQKRNKDLNAWCNRDSGNANNGGSGSEVESPRKPRPPPQPRQPAGGHSVYQQGGVYHQPSGRRNLQDSARQVPHFVSAMPADYDTMSSSKREESARSGAEMDEGEISQRSDPTDSRPRTKESARSADSAVSTAKSDASTAPSED